jgi:two-component system LytT family response regulator
MITCIITDDEQFSIDILTDHIQKTPELKLVSTFTDPLKALDLVLEHPVDLIFLDIDMPRFSGLDFVETLEVRNKGPMPYIIFTTGHDRYAIKGFEHGVTDYLLKPITLKRFKQAIERLVGHLEKSPESEKEQTFFFVESEGKKVKITFSQILYVEAAGNYVKLVTLKERLLLYTSMNAIQAQLPETRFSRIHNSFIVSIVHIHAVTRNEVIISADGKLKDLPVGVTFKEAFFKKLKLH